MTTQIVKMRNRKEDITAEFYLDANGNGHFIPMCGQFMRGDTTLVRFLTRVSPTYSVRMIAVRECLRFFGYDPKKFVNVRGAGESR